jgi:hypothetical protein
MVSPPFRFRLWAILLALVGLSAGLGLVFLGGTTMSQQRAPGGIGAVYLVLGLASFGVMMFATAHITSKHNHLPYWLIGMDRLQFVSRREGVLYEVFFEELARTDTRADPGAPPYVGLTLKDPTRLFSELGGQNLEGPWQKHGHHWRIAAEECHESAGNIAETIHRYYRAWAASHNDPDYDPYGD